MAKHNEAFEDSVAHSKVKNGIALAIGSLSLVIILLTIALALFGGVAWLAFGMFQFAGGIINTPEPAAAILPAEFAIIDDYVECGSAGCSRTLSVTNNSGMAEREIVRNLAGAFTNSLDEIAWEGCSATDWRLLRRSCTYIRYSDYFNRMYISLTYKPAFFLAPLLMQ
ncbi:MAG: hypothetical protein LBB58_06385 [Cellulomonadaceae bacterium]|nr:hypothetical protein [Cellulomonadaceae bacterium]